LYDIRLIPISPFISKAHLVHTMNLRGASLEYTSPKERNRKIDRKELLHLLEEHPDWYLREFAEKFDVWPQAIHKMFRKLGVTYKKNFHVF
jgi:transposase